MSQTNHTIEPIRTQGGLRRLRGGGLQAQREVTSAVLTKPQFQSTLQAEIDRALQDERTLVVAILKVQPVPGHDDHSLIPQDVPHELVERLRTVNDHARVVALSGGELMILIPSIRRRPDGEAAVHEMLEVLTPPIDLDGLDHHLRPLIGAAMLGHGSPSAELLVEGARMALGECGESRPAMMFHPYQRVRQHHQNDMQADLREAVLEEAIETALQPAYDFENDQLVAFEAFARWDRVGKGPVSPVEFVALAKEIGLGHLITRHVLRKSMQVITELQSEFGTGSDPVTLWLNVSPDDVVHPAFASLIVETLEEFDSVTVGLELSPTPDAEAREFHVALKRLVSDGVRVAVGDFGIGNANLTVLRELPFDAVKLDRALIRQMAGSPESAGLVKNLIEMAQVLNLETTAQGIETEAQWDLLVDHRCQIGQGFYYAEPSQTFDDMEHWFSR